MRTGSFAPHLALLPSLQIAGDPAAALDRAAATRYVLSCRTPEGGYCFYRTPKWNVEEPNAPDTLAALESLLILGAPVPHPEETSRWLRELQEEDGAYPTLTIGWAALRACSLVESHPRSSPIAWLREWQGREFDLARGHDRRGGLRELLHFVELLRLSGLGLRREQVRTLAEMLEGSQEQNGGWAAPSADVETSAVALLLAEGAGLSLSRGGKSEAFVRECEDAALGLRLSPSGRATSVGALWGGLTILRLLGRKPAYPGSLARSLAMLQNGNGGLGARHHAISTLQHTWQGLEASRLLHDLTEVRP